MSEPAPSPASAAPAEAEKPDVVRIVLFAVLAVMVVALIYEYGFVRRSYKAAEAAVDDFVDQRNQDLDGSAVTPEVVQAKLGKTPVGGLQDKGDYYLEHYKWVRWLPWKSYDIYVTYEHTDPPKLFSTTRPDPPGPDEVPYPGLAFDPARAEPGGPGPGVPGGPPISPPGRRRPAAEEESPSAVESESARPEQPSDATPAGKENPAAEGEPAADSTAPAENDADSQSSPEDAGDAAPSDASKNE